MGAEPWAPGQHERYARALETAWDDFETAYYATLKRVGLQSMSAQHAQNYMSRARMLKQMVDGLLARPTRTEETPDVIRKAVAELAAYKRGLNEL
jgi:ferritin-like protein